MKKYLPFVYLAVFCFFSCSFIDDLKGLTVPETVTVKSQADYAVPLGSAKAMLSDHFDVSTLTDSISSGESASQFQIFDYRPANDSSLTFLFDYKIAEIPLDMSEYLKNLDGIDLTSQENSFSQEFEVPNPGDIVISKEIDVDFNKILRENMKSSFSCDCIPEFPNGYLDGLQPLPEINIDVTEPDFNFIEFASGKLIVSSKCDEAVGGTVKIRVSLKTSGGEEVGTSNLAVIVSDGTFVGEPIVIDVTGKKITPNMKLGMDVMAEGGKLGVVHPFSFDMGVSDDIALSRISGFSIDAEKITSHALSIEEDFSLASISGVVKSATIKEGSLRYSIKMPDNWSGITIDPRINASGALKIAASEFADVTEAGFAVNKIIDLSEKKLFENPGEENIHINASVPFAISNAELSFNYDESGNSTDKFVFNASAQIKSFKEAQVNINGLMDSSAEKLNKNIRVELPAEMKNYVESITFNKLAVTGTIDTDMPQNDLMIKLKMNSSFFNISNLSEEVDFYTEPRPYNISIEKNYEQEGTPLVKNIASESEIDFDVAMSLSGGKESAPEILTMYDVTLGTKLKMDFNIKFEFDWSEITIKTDSVAMKDEIDTGLNIKKMITDAAGESFLEILDSIKFRDDAIFGNLCVSKPNIKGLEDFEGFGGSIQVYYSEEAGYRPIFETETIKFTSAAKSLSELADEKNIITDDISLLYPEGRLDGATLVNMINSKPENIKFKYDLSLRGTEGSIVTFKRADIESLKEENLATSLKVNLLLGLSLKFATDGFEIKDVLSTFGTKLESDVLNRESAGDMNEDVKKITDVIGNIQLQYLFATNTNLELEGKISATSEGETTPYFSKEIKISKDASWERPGNRCVINLSKEDISSILNNYPFIPVISIEVPANDSIIIPRSAFFEASGILTVSTDGEFVVMGGSK